VCDARTGETTATLRGHTGVVTQVAFSPDARRLATSSADGTAKVWDVRTGQELLTLAGHTSVVSGVAFSPDGRRICTSGVDGTVRVWDAKPSGEEPAAEEMLLRRSVTSLDPDWQADEAAKREADKQWPAAAFHLEQALSARPADAGLKTRLVQALTRAAKDQPESSSTWSRLALAQLSSNDVAGFRQTCKEMQRRFRDPGAFDRILTVRTGALRPDGLAEAQKWLPLAPEGEKLSRGALLYRAGLYAEAVKELESSAEPLAGLFRALALYGQRDVAAARAALDEALKLAPPDAVDPAVQTPTPWPRRVEFEAVRREAEGLIKQRR
jgi:tetratricopeptide (TPR) repeat protein